MIFMTARLATVQATHITVSNRSTPRRQKVCLFSRNRDFFSKMTAVGQEIKLSCYSNYIERLEYKSCVSAVPAAVKSAILHTSSHIPL